MWRTRCPGGRAQPSRSRPGPGSARTTGLRTGEVAEGPGRRRASLVLVARAVHRRAVRVLGGRGEPEHAELADLHARPERDRQVRDVRELERDVAGETRVDEARSRVRKQAKS